MRRMTWLAPLLLGACPLQTVQLHPVSAPPPTKIAAIDGRLNAIEISRGTALAVQCNDSCQGSCKAPALAAEDPSLLDVRTAYRLASASTDQGAFVIAGLAPGRTTLTIRSECATRDYAVTVLE